MRARARGARLVGLALDEHDRQALSALAVDETVDADAGADALRRALARRTDRTGRASTSRCADDAASRGRGSVIAVIGSKGAPGASECAASLAALAPRRWPTRPRRAATRSAAPSTCAWPPTRTQGSLLGVARAADAGDERTRASCSSAGWQRATAGRRCCSAQPRPAQALPELARPGAVAEALSALAAVTPLGVLDVGFQLDAGRRRRTGRAHSPRGARRRRRRPARARRARRPAPRRARAARAAARQLAITTRAAARRRQRPRRTRRHRRPRTLTETLAQRLAERGLALDAALPWDGRALAKATRAGLPLAIAHPRGRYARTLTRLLEQLFLPVAPEPRERKRMLTPPAPRAADEEVALPWRRS